jgi:hypothetical protein
LVKESSPSDKAINDNTQPPAKVGRKAYRVSIETAGLPKYQPIFKPRLFLLLCGEQVMENREFNKMEAT